MPGISLGTIPGHSQDNLNTVPVAGCRPTSPTIRHEGRIGDPVLPWPGNLFCRGRRPLRQCSSDASIILGWRYCREWTQQLGYASGMERCIKRTPRRLAGATTTRTQGSEWSRLVGEGLSGLFANICWPVRELRGCPRGKIQQRARHSQSLVLPRNNLHPLARASL